MTQADREEWLSAAGMTVSEMRLPLNELASSCSAARQNPKCDHPAKIIPAIIEASAFMMGFRRRALETARQSLHQIEHAMKAAEYEPRDRIEVDEVEQANALMAEIGHRTRYHEDGSAYLLKMSEWMAEAAE